MKSKSYRIMSIIILAILVLNIGIFDLSFGGNDLPHFNFISGRVWYDLNSNGIQDDGEAGVQGVRVELYDRFGEILDHRVTNADGIYTFSILLSGTYFVNFDQTSYPEGYFETKRKVGNDTSIDSNGTWTEVVVHNQNHSGIDLGLTNKPYNVRVTQKVELTDESPFVTVGTLYRNTIKTVYGHYHKNTPHDFYKVWYNGGWAYLNIRSVDYNLIKQLNYNVKVKDNNVKLLGLPGQYGYELTTIPKGTVKTVYGKALDLTDAPFYRVWYNGGPAYIDTNHVIKLDYNVRITDKTTVRAYPKGPPLAGYLYKNRIKSAYGYKTDNNGVMWYRVWHNGWPGYVYKLVTSRNLTSVPNFNVKTNVALNVRNGVWGTILGTLPKNTVKTVYGQRLDRDGDTWYRVWYNGGPAYMKAKFTTKQ